MDSIPTSAAKEAISASKAVPPELVLEQKAKGLLGQLGHFTRLLSKLPAMIEKTQAELDALDAEHEKLLQEKKKPEAQSAV